MIFAVLLLAHMAPGPACELAPPGRLPPGCANWLNLRAMLADPADLDAARTLAPPMGEAATRPVERLRRGETPPLPASSTGAQP